MNEVEELCDRILLIDHGSVMLYGELNEMRRRFSGNDILLRVDRQIPQLPGVEKIQQHNGLFKLSLSQKTNPQDILKNLVDKGFKLEQFEIAMPTLDEIFIQVVKAGEKNS